jgi:transposase
MMNLNERETFKLNTIAKSLLNGASKHETALALGITRQHVWRLENTYKTQGAEGFSHKNRGNKPSNAISPELENLIIGIYNDKYLGCKPTFFWEKLTEKENITISKETVRRLLIKHDLWVGKKAKAKSEHKTRDRRPCFGELVQIDGSTHPWFGENYPKATILAAIDDATSEIIALWMCEHETTIDYMNLLHLMVEKHGVPRALYSDKHSVFRNNHTQGSVEAQPTQFGKACNSFGIELIFANSPQAKGRVERLNSTMQNRMLQEFMVNKITTVDEANKFMQEVYMPMHNERFGVEPRNQENLFQPTHFSTEQVSDLLSSKTTAVITKDLEVPYSGLEKIVIIPSSNGTGNALKRQKVVVKESIVLGVRVELATNKRSLDFKMCEKKNKNHDVDTKELNSVLDKIKQKQAPKGEFCVYS